METSQRNHTIHTSITKPRSKKSQENLTKFLPLCPQELKKQHRLALANSKPNLRYHIVKNLQEFLDLWSDFEILSDCHKPGKEMKCKVCDEYLHCKPGVSKAIASRLPSGKEAGCLSTG